MTQVLIATGNTQLEEVRRLMRAFVTWHRQRHLEDIELIDQYFDEATFEAELASLPGKYAPPKGQLLLATYNGEAAGCVALRDIDTEVCEMKRMFVYPHLQGKGVGLALAERVLEEARTMGYKLMRLDTSIRQTEAKTLYQKLGFVTTEPYYDLSETLRNWLVFMEKKL